MNLAIIVLAAGKGTRMESDLAKVLHPLCGKPLVHWVLDAVAPLEPQQTVVVVGHQSEKVEAAVRERFPNSEFALQSPMLGTGHAVQCAQGQLPDTAGDVIILCGDAPLIQSSTLQQLVQMRRSNNSLATMMVAQAADAGSYGRVLVDADNRVSRIVEAKDATPEELAVKTVNAGTYCFDGAALWRYLSRLQNNNKSGEYYLTDVIGFMNEDGGRVDALVVDEREMTGVNTRAQLQELEEQLRADGLCN
jgi:UDP-N-acetylglucosamine diphosphorylase/glucosamine-1-phosphate N-acetyltransferase